MSSDSSRFYRINTEDVHDQEAEDVDDQKEWRSNRFYFFHLDG